MLAVRSAASKQICPVDAYKKRDFDRQQFVDTIDEMCRSCYRCVQGCPRELVFKAMNPQYRQLGDDYYTPEIIGTTWYQAETGKIPVSGAGYGGVFAGEGFDSFWTDMSEIVRPTRDGIHGREYISTSIDLGRKPMFLVFDEQGELLFEPPPADGTALARGPGGAAGGSGPATSAPDSRRRGPDPGHRGDPGPESYHARAAGRGGFPGAACSPPASWTWMIRSWPRYGPWSLRTTPGSSTSWRPSSSVIPRLIVWIKVPGDHLAPDRVAALTAAGAEVIHLAATEKARGLGDAAELHLKDLIRRCHLKLVENQLRDAVTLLASGGIALAEHVAKAIICGADGIIVDIPLLLSLECRLCQECQQRPEQPLPH